MTSRPFPLRFEPEQIDSNRNQIKSYVLLPVPKHAEHTPFESIGRTTFKKYITKSYEDLISQGPFIADFFSFPFVISKEATVAQVVHVQNKPEPMNQMADFTLDSDESYYAPSHRELNH